MRVLGAKRTLCPKVPHSPPCARDFLPVLSLGALPRYLILTNSFPNLRAHPAPPTVDAMADDWPRQAPKAEELQAGWGQTQGCGTEVDIWAWVAGKDLGCLRYGIDILRHHLCGSFPYPIKRGVTLMFWNRGQSPLLLCCSLVLKMSRAAFQQFERSDVVYKVLDGIPFEASILVPLSVIASERPSRPLLVHFHGGAFILGTALDAHTIPLW